MNLTYLPGKTPLDHNEMEGLIPEHIVLQRELNEFEQQNITKAVTKYYSPGAKINLADPLVIRRIHRDMFDDTWKWAGQFRTTIKSIGVFPEKISGELKRACDDLAFWLKNETYPLDETAVRFHFRLVWIHLFPNGNGRHARLIADILALSKRRSPFTWGGGNLNVSGAARAAYITALKQADKNDFSALLAMS